MDELAYRFLVAAHQRSDLRRPLAACAGQRHLAAAHQHAIRRAQTGFQGGALLVGERTDKNGWPHTSQDTPFRPTFIENALGHRSAPRVAPQTPVHLWDGVAAVNAGSKL